MKKAVTLLLIFATIFALVGCKQNPKREDNNVVFYFRTAETTFGTNDGIFATESRNVPSRDEQSVLKAYLKGPKSENLRSPFPENIALDNYVSGPARTTLVLSEHISQLPDHELTIACACIAKTVFDLTDTRSVEIKSDAGLIGGMQSIVLIRNDLIIYDDYFSSSKDAP